ncbi:MAG: hypothetical protein RLY86_1748 [Pseudomonadota bacterium]
MAEFVLPILFTVLLWWASTGLIALLDGLPQRTFVWSMAGATLAGLAGIAAVHWGAGQDTGTGVFAGFIGAILVWGWIEMAFLLGFVTGPVRSPCPPGAGPWRRFRLAVQVILWHELAILAAALVLMRVTDGAAVPVGLWTFLLLWGMRVSAKLNIFLGVPNLGEEFLPPHLAYMASYFRRRPMNLLFPLSITGCTLAVVLFGQAALAAATGGAGEGGGATATAMALLAALSFLALLEHWLMVLPVPSANLWSVYLGDRARRTPVAPPVPPDPTVRTDLAPSTLWRRS